MTFQKVVSPSQYPVSSLHIKKEEVYFIVLVDSVKDAQNVPFTPFNPPSSWCLVDI